MNEFPMLSAYAQARPKAQTLLAKSKVRKNASMKRLVINVLMLLIGTSAILGQNTGKSFPLTPQDTVEQRDCGLKVNRLLSLLQFSDANSLITIISHLGKDEDSKFGLRRLSNIKVFFTWDNLKHKRHADSILIAEGKRIQGKGYLDFYVSGELKLRILLEKNADIYLGDCAPDPGAKPCDTSYEKMFYPCRNRY